jgi:glycerol-3-phosphate dehydrogenase (NAD(P)+)
LKRLAVVGAGSWGTALAVSLASRFDSISLWARDARIAREIERSRQNERYLPGLTLPANVAVSSEIGSVVCESSYVLLVVPSANLREVLGFVRPYLSDRACLVSAAKGIESGSLYRMSQVIAEVITERKPARVAVLSGPTFAREVAAGEPAAVVIASENFSIAEEVQQAFATTKLRFYTSTDVAGVELGAALKNVIAIGAGVCNGLGLGSNSTAALITRGLAEIIRLAVVLGGNPRTLSGLAGLGDLVLTATGSLSRNRFVGTQLGEGRLLKQILSGMTMVAEGVGTCRAAHELGIKYGVDLPIVNKMHEVLYEDKNPREAIGELMERPLTSE